MFYDSNSFPGPRIVPIRRVAGARAPLVVKLDACVATPDTAAAHPILRAGRSGDYVEVTPEALFEMDRPGWPID